MPVSPATADRPPRQRRKPPRFYIFRVVHTEGPLLSVAVPMSYRDFFEAWSAAGELRAQQPHAIFIAGELCSTA